jgi:hypothetical protein
MVDGQHGLLNGDQGHRNRQRADQRPDVPMISVEQEENSGLN